MATSTNRVIALVDMDCFYVQVEERDDPSIKGVPAAVVQYKTYKGGGIIAVNYEARDKGVNRSMRGDDAKAVCPEIQLVRVPETRGKADLTKYRDAGREVINVLTEFSDCVERASIDEAYIDLTDVVEKYLRDNSSEDLFASWGESILQSLSGEYLETNHVLGHESTKSWFDTLNESEIPSIDDLKLAIGAEIVGKMRDAVYRKTKFRCSAGIAHNKVVAKLVCGINKPNKQTVLPHSSVPTLWATTKIGKVRGLGGKLGDFLVERLGCKTVSDLGKYTERELSAELGAKTGSWIYLLSQGYDDEPVTPRQLPKSIGCNKNFLGPEALRTKEKVKFWISQLAAEVVERVQRDLEMNNRRAKTLTLHVKFEDQNALSRSCGVNPQYNPERVSSDAFSVMEKLFQTVGLLPVTSLGLIASKFEDEINTSYTKINNFFKARSTDNNSTINIEPRTVACKESSSVSRGKKDDKHIENTSVIDLNQRNIPEKATPNDGELKKAPSNDPSTNLLPSDVQTSRSSKQLVNNNSNSVISEINKSTSVACLDSATLKDNAVGTGTPKKNSVNFQINGDPRKAFFKFSDIAPLQTSPRKSPRKITAAVKNGDDFITSEATGASVEQKCDRCGKMISLRESASHMDYHYAKDLSREINGLPPLGVVHSESISERVGGSNSTKRLRGRNASTSVSKRGRGAKSGSTSSTSSTQARTIDSYFARKS